MGFNRTIRDYQIRLNSLGILSKPLVVDNLTGPKTRSALALGLEYLGVKKNEEIFHSSGLTRVHWHWTASSYTVTDGDLDHYNDVIDHLGNRFPGEAPAEDQAYYRAGYRGVSHTLNANTGAIGISIDCMHGAMAQGPKVDPGAYPLTWDAVDGMLMRTAEYCKRFNIKVSKWTTLSHAEVQENIGIKQNGKWDIRVTPDDPTKLLTALEVGDIFRARLVDKFLC
jgi:hypothetical protein